MANLWDNLDSSQQNALVKAHVAHNGGSTPENVNRAREQLAANPNLVKRLAKETGLESEDEDAVVQDEEDVAEEEAIDSSVDQTLAESGSMDDTGELTRSMPRPLEGESAEEYYDRLMSEQPEGAPYEGVEPPAVRGFDGTYPMVGSPEEEIGADVMSQMRRQQQSGAPRGPLNPRRRI